MINQQLHPFNNKISKNDQILLLYLLIGVAVVAAISISCAIYSSYIISIFCGLFYSFGFVGLLMFLKIQNQIEIKKIHFNLAMILKNENERLFRHHRVRARPGFLSRWLELHIIQK